MDSRVGAQPSNGAMSRIENDIETLKMLKQRVESITDRILKNARGLGYFDPPPKDSAGVGTIAPVVTTLSDAIRDLDRATDAASGALNVFD